MNHRSMIRRWIRISLMAVSMAGVARCFDGTTAPHDQKSTFGVLPAWSGQASRTMALLDDAGLPLDRVRIVLIKPAADTLKDTTVTVHRGDPEFALPLTVNVGPGVTLAATLQFRSGDVVLFEGAASVVTVPLSRANVAPVTLPMTYVGPGAAATRLEVTPATGTFLTTVANIGFTVRAFDATDAPIATPPIEWSISDLALGTIGTTGVFVPSGVAGTLMVTATAPTGLTGIATVTLSSVVQTPAAIAIVSGNAQVDTIRKLLPNPFVVKVTDAAGLPVPNVTVNWKRVGGFGAPISPTSTTNAAGLASMTYRLGDIGGADTVRASIDGIAQSVTFIAGVRDGLGLPIVTGFAYLRVSPSPVSARIGDTVTFTADSISATGQATPVAVQWASDKPGRGAIAADGRMIVADTGSIIVTATRNAMAGHARVTALPAPKLMSFTFLPTTLHGISNAALTTSFTFAAVDAGAGISAATLTLTSPTGTTATCTVAAPTTGTSRDGVFDCSLTLPAGSPPGAWHVTSLVLTGSITRTFTEGALAAFGTTTLTVNP